MNNAYLRFLGTILLLIAINFVIMFTLNWNFLDGASLIGIFAVLLSIPNKMLSDYLNKTTKARVQGATGVKLEENLRKSNFRLPIFLGALTFTIITGIYTVFEYKEYFM